jgi:hypothetical protein
MLCRGAIFVAWSLFPCLARADDAARSVVDKAIAAHGGEKVAKLKAMQWGGELKTVLPGMGEASITWRQTWRLPDHVRDVQEMGSGLAVC